MWSAVTQEAEKFLLRRADVRARLGIATANAFALYRTGAGFENATPITVLC